MAEWQPYQEPLRATLTRTVGIALVAGAGIAVATGHPARWPVTSLLLLWPSFGGHWLELWFLNWLRPRLPSATVVQVAARIALWFVGGIMLGVGMAVSARAIGAYHNIPWADWWIAGFAFIALELTVQAVLQLRGRPSFFNGRG